MARPVEPPKGRPEGDPRHSSREGQGHRPGDLLPSVSERKDRDSPNRQVVDMTLLRGCQRRNGGREQKRSTDREARDPSASRCWHGSPF
jgi:hypothetical protein